MNIITIPRKTNSTIVAVFAKVGSRDEPNEIKGISHFIEHLCFKGTKKRTTKEISESIEKYGGDINAYTSEEVTCYWAKIANKYTKQALDVIYDLATHPIFPQKEIDKEREVIIQEMKMYEDNPQTAAGDLFNKTFFISEDGLHLSVIGTKESLNAINRNTIINFYKIYYDNLTLLIAGDVNKESYQIKKTISIINTPIKVDTQANDRLIEREDVSQSNVIIGNYYFPSQPSLEVDNIFYLLSSIYNDMSGRLFSTIRIKNNLVYRIRFYYSQFSDGLIQWAVTLGLDKENIEKAQNLIIKELKRPLNKKEIQKAIQKSIGEIALSLDNNNTIAKSVVSSVISGRDYKEDIYNYKKNIIKASKKVNDYIEEIDFDNNLLVGIVPKE
jgi:predicted Zn-dependent peptidase